MLHAEDMEFLGRVIFHGFKVGNMKEILFDCRYSENSVTKTNAFLMYKTAEYCTKIFKQSLKTRQYIFDDNYKNNLVFNDKEKNNFNKKQILMGEARKELTDKNYFRFLFKVFKAMRYSSSVFLSIKINMMFRYYKFLENLELKN